MNRQDRSKMTRSFHFVVIALIFFLAGCESKPAHKKSVSEQIAQGRELYLAYGCAVCHGDSGDGKGVIIIQSTIPPTDLTDPKAYRHGTDAVSIRHAVQFGVKEGDSVMPAFKHLSDEELEQISQYLLSLQKQRK